MLQQKTKNPAEAGLYLWRVSGSNRRPLACHATDLSLLMFSISFYIVDIQ